MVIRFSLLEIVDYTQGTLPIFNLIHTVLHWQIKMNLIKLNFSLQKGGQKALKHKHNC